MMRRSLNRALSLCAAAFLLVSCSENAADPAAPGMVRTVSVHPQAIGTTTDVHISQVYGGGGNSGATYASDFVELFNPGVDSVNIAGWSIQYAGAAGASWSARTITAGKIAPGGYFLVRLTGVSATGAAVPADFAVTSNLDMSGTSGKVLLSRTAAVVSAVACPTNPEIIDNVGFGAAANCGTTWGNTANLSAILSAQRKKGGCEYTASSTNDFTVALPAPRNTSSAKNVCDAVVVTEPATVNVAPPTATIEIGNTQSFGASAADAAGAAVVSTYTWTSSDTDVATVSSAGVATGVSVGTVTITAKSANGIVGTATLTVAAPPSIPDVAISQIYGGGGNSLAPYTNDFIELFNRGSSAVAIGGWSVQYGSSSGTTWAATPIPAGVILQPGQYYLIQEDAGSTASAPLPAPDAIGTSNLSGTAGKVILSRTSAALTGACPISTNVVDRVNFGTGSNCETVWTKAPAPSNTTSISRADFGCTHTGKAADDFASGAPAPRNTTATRHRCQVAPGEPVTITITPATLTLQATATQTLQASAADATGQAATTTYTWTTSNASVATVDAAGVVTAVAVGTATITATAANGVTGTTALTVTAAPEPASGIVITEIFANPNGDETKAEWFEVYNAGTAPVDLAGWQIRSAKSNSPDEVHVIGTSVVVPAGGFAVLGNSANTGLNDNVNVAYEFPSDVITLSNTSTTEWLALRTAGGATADSVAYSARNAAGTVVNPTYVPASGVAREVIDVSVDNSVIAGGNWRDATLPFGAGPSSGTPGYGAYGVAGPVTRLVIAPSPASVLIDGTRAMTTVALDALGHISTASLTWSSSKPSIASIDANGVITGHATGSATITATAASGAQASTTVVVVDPNAPANITLNIDAGPTPAGSERHIFTTVTATDGHTVSAPLTFSTSDPSIARISSYDGRIYVTGVSAGTVEVRATASNDVFGTRSMTILPATAPTTAVYRNHLEFGMPTGGDPNNNLIVTHDGFVSSFNNLRGGPNWVSWNLNASHFGTAPRCNCFSVDQSLPSNVYKVNDEDYVNGGYDRGHMVQSDSRTTTVQENAATFYMTNILPQAALNNQQVWLRFEEFTDSLAEKAGKDIYITAGGEYAPNPPTLKGEGKVAIPDYTWKIAVVMPAGQGLANVTSRESVEVYAVRMPNLLSTATGGSNWQQYQTTVDAIEARTGFDFLNALPDGIERLVESNDHAPVASIAPAFTGVEGTPLELAAAATDTDAGDVLTYAWTFGDGTTGTGATATHTYGDNGTYAVTVIVNDAYGMADTVSTSVVVANAAPAAALRAPATVNEGDAIAISLDGATDALADIAAGFTYAFDCGTGFGSFTTTATASCATTDNGTRTIKGAIRDKDGATTEYTTQVAIANVAPTASLTAPATVVEGSTISFSLGSGADVSTADAAAGFTYAFACGGAAPGVFGAATASTCPTSDNGIVAVTAVIRDKDGGVTTYTADVTVTNAAPVVAPIAGDTILAGETFKRTGSFTDLGADSWTGVVSYGDSVVSLPLVGNKFALSNTYDSAGTYTVSVAITDDDGASGIRTATVLVRSAAEGATALSGTIETLESTGAVPAATASAMTVTLDAASQSLATRDNVSGVNQMTAFKNQVEAALKARRISAATAGSLTSAADRIIASAQM